MSRQLLHFVFFSLLLAGSGCDQAPSLNLETTGAKLVVVSNFTRDKDIQVFVSRSQSILDEEREEYILDATVEIYEDDVYLETLELVDPRHQTEGVPYYTTRRLTPKVNTTYTVQVEASCCDPVTAKSRIPNPINFLSASVSDFALDENREEEDILVSYMVNLSFEDPSEEKNYYHISLFQQIHKYILQEGDTVITESYLRSLAFDPDFNDNGRVAHINGGLLVEDNLLNDGQVLSFELPLNIELKREEELLGKLFLELRSVTEEYYRYFAGLSRQKQSSDSPFSEPVIIYDNIDGGLGIFAGYNSSVDSLYLQ